MFSYYVFKWWKRIFMWCFEVSQMNAFRMFCLKREARTKTGPLIEFKKSLITELITDANKNIPPDQKTHRIEKPTGDVVRKTRCAVWHPDNRNCTVCSTPKLRKRTKFNCETCNMKHPKDCFKEFHSKEK